MSHFKMFLMLATSIMIARPVTAQQPAQETTPPQAAQSPPTATASQEALPKAADAPTANEIYNLTQTAKTAKDFTAIIAKCDLALEATPHGRRKTKTFAADVNALKAWALSKRGQQRIDLAMSIRNAGNLEQFEAVVKAAVIDFDDSIAIDSQKWKPYFGRGVARAGIDQTERAIADLNRAIELNPKSKKAKFNRAELLSWQQRYDQAIEDYEAVIAADADDVQAINGLAFAKLFNGNADQAMELFDRVVELQPDNPTAYQNRAEAHQSVGNWKRAHEDLTTSLNRQATGEGYLKAAWLLSTCPDPDFFQPQTAMAMAKQGQSFDKDSVTTLEVLAAAAAANGEFDTAVRLQQQAISKIKTANHLRIDPEAMKVRLATYQREEVYLQTK